VREVDKPYIGDCVMLRHCFLRFLLVVLVQFASVSQALSGSMSDPMPAYPGQGAVVATNPPVLMWPAAKGPYRVELEHPDGRVEIYAAVRNWLTFERPLLPGEYRWRSAPDTGGWRSFRITTDAIQFPIPAGSTLLERLRAKTRPRTLDPRLLRATGAGAAAGPLMRQVAQWSALQLPGEPPMATVLDGTAAAGERFASVRKLIFDEETRILAAALAWLSLGDRNALAEARRRALNLASMNPEGMTGFAAHDQAGRSVAWTLALVFDWLYAEWSPEERKRLLSAIAPRLVGMLGSGPYGLDGSLRLDANPFNSHGVTALSRSTVICAALAGEGKLYDDCVGDTVPRFLAWPVPWGRHDGGFANGTAYAHWGVLDTQLPVWSLLSRALDLDLRSLPWARNHIQFLAYFLPPGAPTGLFGDETEKQFSDVWATQAKAYATVLPSALADWYARQHFREIVTHPALILNPPRDWKQVPGHIPPGTPNAMLLSDIGWAAMHSDLGDRSRTSMYFKSSPYGSYNHSHADQNSFVIHARGRALAIDSGYYDYYGSPHWSNWYKQTRAHNAITFDGGQGQAHDTMAAKGRITHFEHRPEYDSVTGDATQAYGGALTRSVRSLVYLRPDTLLVFDSLASDIPRTWEWNIHALSRMKENGGRSMEIEHDGVRLCVTLLEAPQGVFDQSDRFTAAPQGKYPPQWHARYSTREKTRQAEFVVSLVVGCQSTPSIVAKESNGWIVAVDGRRLAFRAGKVESLQ
jgi:hypothetical protein